MNNRNIKLHTDNDLLKQTIKNCPSCQGHMYLKRDTGIYKCYRCGYTDEDDFKKVKDFLDAHGPCSIESISESTGVSSDDIAGFLKEGRIEIVPGQKPFLKCEICGSPIRYGRFCETCIRESSQTLYYRFNEAGVNSELENEISKKSAKPAGKMRFIKRDR